MRVSPHRPTRARINLAAISENLEQVAEHIPESTLKWAVVKANAYGHGAVRVAQHLASQVDGFCVSNIDEGLELREAGLDQQILVLGVSSPSALALAVEHDLVLTVASLDWIRLARESQDLTNLRVHLKVDSGMGRIGFRSLAEVEEAMEILTQEGCQIEGIFTHFATADEENRTKFDQQLTFFKDLLSELETCPPLVHASNSATSLWHAETIFKAVRLGVVLYGLNPSGSSLALSYPIRPALSLETEIVHVKQVEVGAEIGYGATYQAKEIEFIATLPIGYADGWIREMQDFSVLVEGAICSIVGRVSMDQTTIRLPRLYPLGTKVVLIGQSQDKHITATQVAEHRGTINYEVTCLLSDRIPRIYEED